MKIETRLGYRRGMTAPAQPVPYDTDLALPAALEALGLIGPALPVRTLRQSREAAALAGTRTCYDHLDVGSCRSCEKWW